MAKLVQPPQRFNPQEWVISNQRKNTAAEEERALAQRIIAESSRSVYGGGEIDIQERNRRL